ncbi:MAG: hypothetical protein QUS66_06945, partial [Bacteroidota bacterium]|nr:hypothetical protein [Bacteroidota bacterium]
PPPPPPPPPPIFQAEDGIPDTQRCLVGSEMCIRDRIMLMLSGSFGFTLIRHTCFHCGTNETVAAIAPDQAETGCCCQEDCDMHHHHSTGESVLSDDCCTHETERIVTDEPVRFEVQHEILPYFMAASVVAVLEECPVAGVLSFEGDKPLHGGPALTTMHCRIQS